MSIRAGGLDRNGLQALLAALGQGVSPQLRSLDLQLRRSDHDAAACLELLFSTLEARRARGCPGMHSLDLGELNWTVDGPLEVQRRLWSLLLLPTVSSIPIKG